MKDEVTTMKDKTQDPKHDYTHALVKDPMKEPGKTVRKGWLRARMTPHLALAVAALLLLAGGAIGVTKARPYYAARDHAEQGAAALAAGRQLAVNFVTMDYRTSTPTAPRC
jgi:Mce-associated membrane protein